MEAGGEGAGGGDSPGLLPGDLGEKVLELEARARALSKRESASAPPPTPAPPPSPPQRYPPRPASAEGALVQSLNLRRRWAH